MVRRFCGGTDKPLAIMAFSSILLHGLFRALLLLQWISPTMGYAQLSDRSLKSLPEPGPDFNIDNGALLAPILRPRVPGTKDILEVLQHFVDFFEQTLPYWQLELHNTTMDTALGHKLPFVNLIATRDPPWSKPGHVSRLALTAHYDSLSKPDDFIGAVDSAAPCAMLMHIARSIDPALTQKWKAMEADRDPLDDIQEEKGVQIILFDGEEAFEHWTDQDSIYGSRALAEDWERQSYSAMSPYQNPLRSISLFVLLDLLGAADPRVPSYFSTTHWAYKAMSDLERRLRSNGLFKSSPNALSKRMPDANGRKPPMRSEILWLNEAGKKHEQFRMSGMGDDHVPFLARGVQILHLIPTPFPDVWHNQMQIPDDGEHLDLDVTEDWAKLVLAFTAEWLELDAFMSSAKTSIPIAARSHIEKSEL